MTNCLKYKPKGQVLMRGAAAIAEYCGVTQGTIVRWIRTKSFPACKNPKGRWITSPSLIDGWIMSRAIMQKEQNKVGEDRGRINKPDRLTEINDERKTG